jgi:uncharacterized integral membrane protein
MGTQPDDGEVESAAGSERDDSPNTAEVSRAVGAEKIASTRTSRAWIRVLPALVVVAVLLVFVFQNTRDVTVRFFTVSGTFPLALSLVCAAALGALTVLALGSLRIFQLRRQIHRSPGGSQGN